MRKGNNLDALVAREEEKRRSAEGREKMSPGLSEAVTEAKKEIERAFEKLDKIPVRRKQTDNA